jgi:NAD(P) transhydrogenase subunit alpha
LAAILAANEGPSHSLPFLLVGLWALLLAIFAGVELISKVPPTLHTPLMSGSNAISGITIVGALYCSGTGYPLLGQILGFFAIAAAMVNVVGGFLVTDRMLRMFGQKKGPGGKGSAR